MGANRPAEWVTGWLSTARRVTAALVDLVLPSECAGCGDPADLSGVCARCAVVLGAAPGETRPDPAPDGLPSCLTLGEYAGPLRELILGYKERGRRGLAGVLGDALAEVVQAGMKGANPASGELVLVPVPSTAAAIRARHGDHMLGLARRAQRRLAREGWQVTVARPLRARHKMDSTHLDRYARALAARGSFELRPGADLPDPEAVVVLVDDLVTTGATLAAMALTLAAAGAPVAFAATIGATRLRTPPARHAGRHAAPHVDSPTSA